MHGCDERVGYLPEVENGRTHQSPQTALQGSGLEAGARSKDVNRRSLEVGITQTLMRMSSLYQLYAGFLGEKHKFSAATILWQSMTEFFKCIQAA